ncbi:glucoside xylosyltransferase 1-like [Amblyomma americanum]
MTQLRAVLLSLCVLAAIGGLIITHLGYINVGAKWSSGRRHVENETQHSVPATATTLAQTQHSAPVTATTLARPSQKMTLVFVICEDHFTLGLVAIKSAVAYSTTKLHLVVIADDHNLKKMRKEYASWPASIRKRVTCAVRPVWFPKDDYYTWWAMFRPCTTQRLFLPSMLPDVDAVLYADTDVVFIHPVEDFWRMFYAMNEWQMAGMAPETESFTENYYLNKALHPFVRPFALNAGLLLMNLTRMRAFGMEGRVLKLRKEFQGRIPWADQDLLNIVFARYPQGIFTFTCRWNFRFEHCLGSAICTDGPVAVMHGARRQVLDRLEPAYMALHEAMLQYNLGESLVERFIEPLNKSLSNANVTGCTMEFSSQLYLWRLSASRVDSATAQNGSKKAS